MPAKQTVTTTVTTPGQLRMIALTDIEPAAHNTRRHFDRASLRELAASIRRHGVLQPILVRENKPTNDEGKRFCLIAGERRFRAAREAGLAEIPAQIRAMDDTEALGAQMSENLQRRDVHPLDEAAGFMVMQRDLNLTIKDIAQRLAKDTRYVARRLALNDLIAEARANFRHDRITLAHALEICRLAPEIQLRALVACYESSMPWQEDHDGNDDESTHTRPARDVRYLREWIAEHVHLDLGQAPFDLADTLLRDDGLTCLQCPQRTGTNKTLFADVGNGDTCLNPVCYQIKLRAFLHRRKNELETRHRKPVVYISRHYGRDALQDDIIGRQRYQPIERRRDRCAHAEPAICADGPETGQTKWICRAPDCPDHHAHLPLAHRAPSGQTSVAETAAARNQRKQELFDIRVDEAVRVRVMREAIQRITWPPDRGYLNQIAGEFFRRLPNSEQKTVAEVFAWQKPPEGRLVVDEEQTLRDISQLDDDRLAQFLALCSFAHYGANPMASHRVDQSVVIQLGEKHGGNCPLIDAQVRVELSPKKYRAAHQAYLDAVTEGKGAAKPVVFETATPDANGKSAAGADDEDA